MNANNDSDLKDEKLIEIRSNIIKWYEFDNSGSALIIGDKTGSLTRYLATKVRKVTALVEKNCPNSQNILDIAIKLGNVDLINDEFCNANFATKFDYIIMIGSLHFYNSDNINVNIMNKVKKLLTDDGTILLAENNKLSLKSLSETNTDIGIPDGLTKSRLEKILALSNLNNYRFYYPLPDYNITNVIFSEKLIPTSIDLDRNMDLKKQVEKKKFDDRRILVEIAERSKVDFEKYCNSFLIEIKKNLEDEQVKAIYYNNIRKEKYRLVTKILDDKVLKESINEESKKHLQNIAKNLEILKNSGINSLDTFDGKKIISKYICDAETMQNVFLRAFRENRTIDLLKLVEKYKDELLLKLGVTDSKNNVFEKYNIEISQDKLEKMTFVKNGLYDLVFANIFIIDKEFFTYDQEWIEENMPIEMILFRSIRYMPQMMINEKEDLYRLFKIDEFINEFTLLEEKIQSRVLDKDLHEACINNFKSYECINTDIPKELYDRKVQEKEQEIQEYKEQLDFKQKELELKQKELELKQKQLDFKQSMIDSKDMMSAYLNTQLEDFSTAYFTVNDELQKMQRQLDLKNHEVNMLYASEQYQKGEIAIRREKKLYPVLTTVRGIKEITKKIFRPIKRGILAVIRKCGKTLYDIYPVKAHKRKIKNKFLYSEKLAKIANVKMKKEYCYDQNIDTIIWEDGREERCVKFQTELNKTIGIHLHLYYTDLLDEFYNYFCHIPYVFDLFVSVMEDADVEKIRNKFNKILNLNKVKVVVTPNSGRDFGAMFVEFREDLKKYDYIMHVHSKKTLRMGSEQTEWRRFMLDHLLGSTERVMKNFYLMEQMNMGMVYVDDCRGMLPYFASAWLAEAPLAKEIFRRMGMEEEFKDEILQFPAGSMFWAKKDAFRQLLDLELTWDDFGYEDGRNDATLAYVFERITAKVVMHNNYKTAIFNVYENKYLVNKGRQLWDEYTVFNKENVFQILSGYDIVSFDIFDTLVARHVYKPDDSFEIVANRIDSKGIKVEDYFKARKEAEFNVRKNKNFQGDCSIHEIYEEFQVLTGLSKEDTEIVKQTEIDTELELVMPRREMLEIYNRLLKNNKKIVIITDMYLTKDIITKILNKCGYYNWFDLLVSSELGFRKDNDTMWHYFLEKYGNCSTDHVGDNEYADTHAPIKLGRPSFYVMKSKKLNILMGGNYVGPDDELNLLESIVVGSVINKVVCNSPFVLNNWANKSFIDSYYNYGYGVLGPIIFGYMLWIYKMAKEQENGEVLLFSAREGYYLQKLYNIFKEKLGDLPKVEDHYLYISRRAVTVMSIETIDDVRKIMETQYNGSLREVLYYRLNYQENNFEDEVISLPRDIDKVMKVVEENFDVILTNAKCEKEKYLKYIDSLNIDFENKKVSVLDLGYAGTAQYYLAKLLNKKIDGKYFVVQSKLKPTQLGCDVYSCYNKDICSSRIEDNVIYNNSLLIESFLTSPDGQFLYMDIEDGKYEPRFLYEPRKAEQIKMLDQVYEGVKDYTETILNLMGDKIFNYNLDHKYIYNVYENCLSEVYKFDDQMKKMFLIEDYYCSNAIINSFEVLSRRRKEWNRD